MVAESGKRYKTIMNTAGALDKDDKHEMYDYIEKHIKDVRINSSEQITKNIFQHLEKLAKKRSKEVKVPTDPNRPPDYVIPGDPTSIIPVPPYEVKYMIPIVEEKFI